MIDWGLALRVFLVGAAVAALAWFLFALVRGAKRGGGKGMYAFGAAMMMLGWGHMRDPRNDTVAEAKDGRAERGTHSGDPLEPDPK